MILNIPEYDGVAIYSLEDEEGRVYIGSTCHLRTRIVAHRNSMRAGRSSRRLQEAHNAGARFTVHIIKELPPTTTWAQLRTIEAQAIEEARVSGAVYNDMENGRIHPRTDEDYTRGHYSGIRDLSQPLRPDLIKKAGE